MRNLHAYLLDTNVETHTFLMLSLFSPSLINSPPSPALTRSSSHALRFPTSRSHHFSNPEFRTTHQVSEAEKAMVKASEVKTKGKKVQVQEKVAFSLHAIIASLFYPSSLRSLMTLMWPKSVSLLIICLFLRPPIISVFYRHHSSSLYSLSLIPRYIVINL